MVQSLVPKTPTQLVFVPLGSYINRLHNTTNMSSYELISKLYYSYRAKLLISKLAASHELLDTIAAKIKDTY